MALTKPTAKTDFQQQEIQNLGFDTEFNVPVTEQLGYDGANLQRMNASNLALRTERDGQGNPIYLGLARTGTLTSAASWQIRKLTFDGANNVTAIQYADGDANFDNVWDNRGALSYT